MEYRMENMEGSLRFAVKRETVRTADAFRAVGLLIREFKTHQTPLAAHSAASDGSRDEVPGEVQGQRPCAPAFVLF